jgi:hypothetical protein
MAATAWSTSTNGTRPIPARLAAPLYWGHYVAHDNNRDAMGMTLDLTQQCAEHLPGWHAQVLHDLHESVPFLYDNTVGDGPYNAWIDPTLGDEWAELGWNNVAQMQSARHARSLHPRRLRHLEPRIPDVPRRHAQRHQPSLRNLRQWRSRHREAHPHSPRNTRAPGTARILPPSTVVWSQRDNNNYEETALLTTLSYFSHNTASLPRELLHQEQALGQKPTLEGPAAYVIPATARSSTASYNCSSILKLQHVEIQQLIQSPSPVPPARKARRPPKTETFAAGSIVIRMDQPFSRVADALLDKQFWAPDDPQKHPYDDTGWSFSQLFNVKATRVTDRNSHAKMTAVLTRPQPPARSAAPARCYAIAIRARPRPRLMYQLKGRACRSG